MSEPFLVMRICHCHYPMVKKSKRSILFRFFQYFRMSISTLIHYISIAFLSEINFIKWKRLLFRNTTIHIRNICYKVFWIKFWSVLKLINWFLCFGYRFLRMRSMYITSSIKPKCDKILFIWFYLFSK